MSLCYDIHIILKITSPFKIEHKFELHKEGHRLHFAPKLQEKNAIQKIVDHNPIQHRRHKIYF